MGHHDGMENTNLPETTAAPFLLSDAARRALFLEARSAVAFADVPVDTTVVHRVWDLAKWGPTSNNTQPLRLVIASSAPSNAQQRLAPLFDLAAGGDQRLHRVVTDIVPDKRYLTALVLAGVGPDEGRLVALVPHVPVGLLDLDSDRSAVREECSEEKKDRMIPMTAAPAVAEWTILLRCIRTSKRLAGDSRHARSRIPTFGSSQDLAIRYPDAIRQPCVNRPGKCQGVSSRR